LYYLKSNFREFDFVDLVYAILYGYKFDFAVSSFVSLLISLVDFHKKTSQVIAATFLSSLFFIQISDILYFHESSRHIGYEITDTITDANSLFMTAYSQHTVLTLSSIFSGIILFYFIFKITEKLKLAPFNKKYIIKKVFLVLLTIFFLRGMTQSIPLNPWQSNQIGDTKLASLSLNATYNILYSLANKKKKLQMVTLPYVSKEIIEKSFASLYLNNDTNRTFPVLSTKPNVIFLFLESWSAKLMKPYGYAHNTTPFFNKLLTKSMRPKVMIAGGHRTTEGMFTSLTSLQNPLGKSVARTQLQNNDFISIVDILNIKGYRSAFFQGTSKETSGTGSFAQTLGFKYSYGKADVKRRVYEENSWGVHDTDLYNFVQTKLKKELKEPFVLGINGATTHDIEIPKNIKNIKFVEDEFLNKQLNALHFADKALKDFVHSVERKYPNTIFVLFADHCGGGISDSLENYMIPFAVYSKELIEEKYFNNYVSQRDIAPTIYDLVIGNYQNTDYPFTGKSLVRESDFFIDYYHNGILGWIENNDNIEINIANNKMKCFEIVELKRKEVQCLEIHTILKENTLSFANLSQKMLFENNLKKLNILRER